MIVVSVHVYEDLIITPDRKIIFADVCCHSGMNYQTKKNPLSRRLSTDSGANQDSPSSLCKTDTIYRLGGYTTLPYLPLFRPTGSYANPKTCSNSQKRRRYDDTRRAFSTLESS